MSKYSNFSKAVGNLADAKKEYDSKSKEWRDTVNKQDGKTKRMIGDYVQDTSLGGGGGGRAKPRPQSPKRTQSEPLHSSSGSTRGSIGNSSRTATTATSSSSTMRTNSSQSIGRSGKMSRAESHSTIRSQGGSEINISEDVACEIDVETAYIAKPRVGKSKHRTIGAKPKEGDEGNTKDGVFWIKDDTSSTGGGVNSYKEMKKNASDPNSFLSRPKPMDKDKYMTSLNIHT